MMMMTTMLVRVEMKEEVMVTSGYDDFTTEKCVCACVQQMFCCKRVDRKYWFDSRFCRNSNDVMMLV